MRRPGDGQSPPGHPGETCAEAVCAVRGKEACPFWGRLPLLPGILLLQGPAVQEQILRDFAPNRSLLQTKREHLFVCEARGFKARFENLRYSLYKGPHQTGEAGIRRRYIEMRP